MQWFTVEKLFLIIINKNGSFLKKLEVRRGKLNGNFFYYVIYLNQRQSFNFTKELR